MKIFLTLNNLLHVQLSYNYIEQVDFKRKRPVSIWKGITAICLSLRFVLCSLFNGCKCVFLLSSMWVMEHFNLVTLLFDYPTISYHCKSVVCSLCNGCK